MEYRCQYIFNLTHNAVDDVMAQRMNTPPQHNSYANLHELLSSSQRKHFQKNQLIQTSEENKRDLYFIITGFVKRYSINNEGSKSVQVIYGPEDLFPLTLALNSLLDQHIYQGLETYYYEAMQDTETVVVDIDTLRQTVNNAQPPYRDILEAAGKRLHSNIQRLENQSLENTYKKVAHQLIFYARRFGVKEANGTKIMLPLTHQDIAEVLNVARETVTREIAKLRDNSFIVVNDYIVLPDIENLEQEAHS